MFIKRAAILYQRGGIFEGYDYTKIANVARQMGITGSGIQGFVDSNDTFIDRFQAMKIAKDSGQVPEDTKGSLHPEDIFGNKEIENAID